MQIDVNSIWLQHFRQCSLVSKRHYHTPRRVGVESGMYKTSKCLEIFRRGRFWSLSCLNPAAVGSRRIQCQSVTLVEGDGRGKKNRKKKKTLRKNNHSHQGLYRFHLPWPRSGLRVASGGETVSGDIISLLFTQGGRELEEGWVSQATFFFTSFSWSEDHGIKEGLVATWDLCDWLIYCGDGRSFIYGNI